MLDTVPFVTRRPPVVNPVTDSLNVRSTENGDWLVTDDVADKRMAVGGVMS